jgi:hypothetical protein
VHVVVNQWERQNRLLGEHCFLERYLGVDGIRLMGLLWSLSSINIFR